MAVPTGNSRLPKKKAVEELPSKIELVFMINNKT
jgi:hypothetical protein